MMRSLVLRGIARPRRQIIVAALALSVGLLLSGGAAAQVKADGRAARIGVLVTSSRPTTPDNAWGSFLPELAKSGWVEGRNLTVDWRYADGVLERLDVLAEELVALKPDAIVAGTQPAALAAKKATATIPIVFAHAPDPVESGLVDNLVRPGRNVTGFASLNSELVVKRLEFLQSALPKCKRVAVLYQPDFGVAVRQLARVEQVASTLGLEVVRVHVGAPQTFDTAFAQLVREHPDAVLVIESPSLYTNRRDILRRMSDAKLPAMYGLQDFALDGGLASYSISFKDQYRRAAEYVARILRGEKPSDLPVQLPLKFELTVNLKAIADLGIKLPQSVLARIDRTVE
jgi:putative ABC transport system substrate-binding protein